MSTTPSPPRLGETLQALPVEIDGLRLQPLAFRRGGWTRKTTVIHLRGGGEEGLGEDVAWATADHDRLLAASREAPATGRLTLGELFLRLAEIDLFPEPPRRSDARLLRRWAFESAALDLALRQAGRSFASMAGRRPRPVRFVASTGLGDPPSVDPLLRLRERVPGLRFKVDLAASWTESIVKELAATGAVDTVDLKGLYRHEDYSGPPADPLRYGWVAEHLPGAWIEDPELNPETREALRGAEERITWDAALHSLEDLRRLPWKPRCVNIKPSRFGSALELLRVYAFCEHEDIAMYGGGQFELGPGRGQIQLLASLFHPDGANDVAPLAYHRWEEAAGLPSSPLPPSPADRGFRWTDPLPGDKARDA